MNDLFKIMPTDAQIDLAAAKAAGWHLSDTYGHYLFGGKFVPAWVSPDSAEDTHFEPPTYCSDRTALPELWRVIEAHHAGAIFARHLMYQVIGHPFLFRAEDIFPCIFDGVNAAPRKHVVAFLITMDAWPAEWDSEP